MKKIHQFSLLLFISLSISAFFVLIGRDSWDWGIFLNKLFYFDLACVTIIVFILLSFLIWQNKILNQKFSWFGDFWKRLINQFFFGVITPVFLSVLLVFLYMEFVLDYNIIETSYFSYELPISAVFFVLFNLVFGIMYLLKERKKVPNAIPINRVEPILGQKGKNKILIEQQKIQLVEKIGVVNIIFCNPLGQFLYPNTLEEIEGLLDSQLFFRANRQAIVNRENCKSYRSERSGKVILELKCPESKQLTISQKKAKEFKSWLTQKTLIKS